MTHDGTISTELVELAKMLTSGKKEKKQKWMAEFSKKSQKLQKRQDYWDTAAYLYNQGISPSEAAKKILKTAAGEPYDPRVLAKTKQMWREILSNIDGEFYPTANTNVKRLISILTWDLQTDNNSDLKSKNNAIGYLEHLSFILDKRVKEEFSFNHDVKKPLKGVSDNLKKIL